MPFFFLFYLPYNDISGTSCSISSNGISFLLTIARARYAFLGFQLGVILNSGNDIME